MVGRENVLGRTGAPTEGGSGPGQVRLGKEYEKCPPSGGIGDLPTPSSHSLHTGSLPFSSPGLR